MVCKNIPKEGDTSKVPPVAPKKATLTPLPQGSEETGHPILMASLLPFSVAISCYPLQLVSGERGSCLERIHVPFRLSDPKEIKQDLGNFTNDPEWYTQDFITVVQTFELAWKDVILILDQTFTSLHQQRVLDQVTYVNNELSPTKVLC
jgi:hypothetical protein